MVLRMVGMEGASRDRPERSGRIAHGLRRPARTPPDPPARGGRRPRANRADARPLARHASRRSWTSSAPRRSARTASPGSPAARSSACSPASASPSRASTVRLGDGLDIELDLDGRLRRAGRRGRPPGRLGRPLRAPADARARGPPAGHPRRRAAGPARRRAARPVVPADPDADPAARPRRQRDGRRLMARRACDGAGLLEAFRAAVANLEAHVDEINALNVYPVPDGDTGSNMLRDGPGRARGGGGRRRPAGRAGRGGDQLRGADGRARQLRASSPARSSAAWPRASAARRRFNGLDLAHALSEGAKTAYGAVAKPVEGTILTVIRESAAAAVAAAERDDDIETVLGGDASTPPRSRSPGRRPCSRSCARPASSTRAGRASTGCSRGRCSTSSGRRRRPAARDADAGAGRQAVDARRPRRRGLRLRDDVPAPAERRRQPLDVDAIRDHLESIGESVLVAGDAPGAQGPRPQRAPGPRRSATA